MKWKKISIYTTVEAEDLVSMMLAENGVEGVEISDNVPLSENDTKGMFIDILPELPADNGEAVLSFYLHLQENNAEAERKKSDDSGSPDAEDRSYEIADRLWSENEIEELMETIKNELSAMSAYTDVGEARIEIGQTEDTDWRDNWKKFFKPILVEHFIIKPTWEEVPPELSDDVKSGKLTVIEIDPGTAFGTGSHETTQLCIKQLIKYISGAEKVLDIGTGSGILGIAALKSGAKYVCGTELDEMCEPSIKDNLSSNGILPGEFRLVIGNVLGDEKVINDVSISEGYDMVTANILAPVIIMLAGKGAADSFIKTGGVFITSGIIDTKENEVVEAFNANPAWEIVEKNHLGEWVNITAVRL